MNEHVKELVEKAGFELAYVPGGKDSEFYYEDEFAALVKLVVKECARIAAELASSYLAQRRAADDFIEKNVLAEGQTAAEQVQMRILAEFGIAESTQAEE